MPHNTALRPSRSRFAILMLFVLALGLSLAACSSSSKSGSAGSSKSDITVQDFKFTTTPVKAGATVTVHNNGPSDHTVTADDSSAGFDITINSGKDATFTAPSKPGTYKFHCNFHTQMHGTLTVQ